MNTRSIIWRSAIAVLIAAFVTASLQAPAHAGNAKMMSDDADGTNWPVVGRTYSENYFSPLTEINAKNIERLQLAWFIDLPTMIGPTSTPLAVDGVLYFAVGFSVVHAADARTGKILWSYDPKVAEATNDKLQPAWGIRGLAYADDRVFVGTQDGRLIALDSKDGKLVWSTDTTMGPDDGRYITGAPRVFNGKVIIGHGGADGAIPIRGYVTAYDVTSGKQAWRFFIVPGDPAKGFENKAMEMAAKTWNGEWWKHGGGGAAWNAMVYDPKYNRVYIGTGNGQPWNRNIRSPGGGDNLFLCSIVAVDADTGEYVWHYQTTPGESWDFNSVMDITQATVTIDGKARDVILHAPKNGFFYVIDRANGKLISAEPFTKVTWAKYIDKETGRPVETPEARYPTGASLLYPSGTGAHSWYPMSYNPVTGLVYIPTNFFPAMYDERGIDHAKWKPRDTPIGFQVMTHDPPEPDGTPLGMLQAWDPLAQKAVWTAPSRAALDGGVLSTAGKLVFQGMADGRFLARDAMTGKIVWTFDAQNGLSSQPISYTVGGKQYITIIAGFTGSPALHGPVAAQFGWQYRTQLRRVLTFALDGGKTLPPKPKNEPEVVQDDPAFKIDQSKLAHGAKQYAMNCLICHGAGAVAAGSAPDLRTSPIPLSQETFDDVVLNGALRPNGMAKFDNLTPADTLAIRHYLRERARKALTKKQASQSTQ